MPLNGLILVSSWLNPFVDFSNPPFSLDVTYELYLPTMAATAWYHHKLPREHPDLGAFLEEVRGFALGAYQHALTQGSHLSDAERDSVVTRLHEYTGLPEAYIREARLRITASRFRKELLRGESRTTGRLDARFLGIDHDAAGEVPEYDATDAAIDGAFNTAFNSYVKDQLNYDATSTYLPTNYPLVGADWDDRHRVAGGRYPVPDVSEDLREAMSQNPYLRIFSANGYYDFGARSVAREEHHLRILRVGPHDLPPPERAGGDEEGPGGVLRRGNQAALGRRRGPGGSAAGGTI
jgi:carboxypeptidase C (cathepsin A)